MQFQSELIYDKLGNPLFRCHMETNDGVVEKSLSVEDYQKVINSSITVKRTYVSIGGLPQNYFNAQISSDNEGCFKVLLVYKKQKRALAYGGEHFFIPFPSLMFYLHYEDGLRKESRVFALDTDEPSMDSVLYEYPFGNVNESGGICFGNIKLPKVKCIKDTERIPEEFFLGKTQGDLYHSQNSAGLSQGELITYLQDKEEYPVELLKKHEVLLFELF